MKPNKPAKVYYLYCLYEVVSGKVFYIGITGRPVSYRLKGHIRDAFIHKNKVSNKIRKLIKNNVKFDIMRVMEYYTPEEVSLAEREYILWARNLGFKLYNMQDGGWEHHTHSKETRKKLSRLHKGKDNAGQKNPMFGKKHSEETRKKIGAKSVGRRWSEENKLKQSQRHLGTKRPGTGVKKFGKDNAYAKAVAQISLLDNSVVEVFGCIKDAAKKVDRSIASIGACANNKRQTSAGYRWVFCNKDGSFK